LIGVNLLWWDGVNTGRDKAMVNHLRFTQDAIKLRGAYPALRGDNVHPYWFSDQDRVLAFHRWLEGTGQDVIVVATLCDTTWGYAIGFPSGGYLEGGLQQRCIRQLDLRRFSGEALGQPAACFSNCAGLAKSRAEWRRTGL
jgi:hypothetical protein